MNLLNFNPFCSLQPPDTVFSSSIDLQAPDGFYDLTDSMLGGIFHQCSKIQRLAVHSGQQHYQADIEEIKDLAEKRAELMHRVTVVLLKASQLRSSFDQFVYLWTDDRAEFMRQFLLYNHVLTSEEVEQHADEGVPEIPPTLFQFQEQVHIKMHDCTCTHCIDSFGNLHILMKSQSIVSLQINSYERIYDEVLTISDKQVFDTWFHVDVTPFKRALLNIVNR